MKLIHSTPSPGLVRRSWGSGLSALVLVASGTLVASCILVGCTSTNDPPSGSTGEGGTTSEELDEAPLFGGVMKAELEGGVNVKLSWEPGYDDHTKSEHLVYRVFLGKGEEAVNISTAVVTSLPGATSVTVPNLGPGKYRFVVRAVDRAGQTEDNRHSVSVAVEDKQAPVFEGVTGVIPLSASHALVEWKPAQDDGTPASRIEYQVFVSTDREQVLDVDPVVPPRGVTKHLIDIPPGVTEVWITVRARDEAGNVDTNERRTSSRAQENESPQFAGLTSAVTDGTSVKLRWAPATDNATSTSDMVYRVFAATESGDYNLLTPTAFSAPGATQYTLTDLAPETQYFFLVQAQDLAGNRDQNQLERSTVTGEADETAPVFEGVTQMTADGPRSATLSWSPATDDRTVDRDMTYQVFLSTASGDFDFETPHATTLPGRTSLVLLGLEPATEYFAVVRALDSSQNVDENAVELSATTAELAEDNTAPSLSGALTVRQVPSEPGWLEVIWAGASDDQSPASTLRGHVCVAESASECQDEAFYDSLNHSGSIGSLSTFVTGLKPRTNYWVSVRLEDANGNLMSSGPLGTGITATSYTADVQPLLDGRCNQCHNFLYGNLVNVFSDYEGLYFINPASVSGSYLIRSLRAPGDITPPFAEDSPANHALDRMPSDGTDYLSADQEAVFTDWITQGAFQN